MIGCPCGGEIKKSTIDYPNINVTLIYCKKCKRTYTWKEYQTMRANKLIEMMKENG